MKPKPFEIIVEFTPQSTKTGITYEAHQKGSLIRCKDCKHRPYRSKDGEVIPRNEITNRCPCVNDDDWYYNWYPEDDWYCANAEPKEPAE